MIVVVDDTQAKLTGNWASSTSQGKWVGASYLHDGDAAKGQSSAVFRAKLPRAGRYEVRLAYSANPNRAKAVPVAIRHADGEATLTVNQQKQPPSDGLFLPLGTYRFTADRPAEVVIANVGTKGHVILDAVQWLPVE